MTAKNLEDFGKTLRALRRKAGYSQEALAEQLSLLHARITAEDDLRLDGNRVSKWERAFVDKVGRAWRPKREHMLYLLELFAGQLSLEAAQTWADQAGYHLGPAELRPFFPLPAGPGAVPAAGETPTRAVKLLQLPSEQRLFGVDFYRQQVRELLERDGAPWLIALDGIGGIGKTSLAGAVVRDLLPTDRFEAVAWVSARQEEYVPDAGLKPILRPALTEATLVHELLEQFGQAAVLGRPADEKLMRLTQLIQEQPCLIVIDNLETVGDYERLLPLLRRLGGPSKFLLTSRHSLRAHSDVYSLNLNELSPADTVEFLKFEAGARGLAGLVEAAPDQFERIYEVAGGNPLALKLVVGQTTFLPLEQVLENLKAAQGKKIDDLYVYIYWQAWRSLKPAGQEVLLVMPLAQGGGFPQLRAVTGLPAAALSEALEQLIRLSLVEVGGDLEQRRYTIHRLTETFLLEEVIKWQSLP